MPRNTTVSDAEREAQIVTEMARTLAGEVAKLQAVADGPPAATFLHYRRAREQYQDIHYLIADIQERARNLKGHAPKGLDQWVIRSKLKALSAFTRVSHQFFRNPPITITHSLGAWDILSEEREAFAAVNAEFDRMVLEAGIDDRTADTLEATREEIAEILVMLADLLRANPTRLEEF